jgi:hypothetical protein
VKFDPHFAAKFVPEMKRELNWIVGDSGSEEYIMIMSSDNLMIIIVENKAGRKRRTILMMLQDSLDPQGYGEWLALIGSNGE